VLRKATVIWIAGLLTLVPYGTYYLLAHATRDQYALLITLVLFWIFGYWGVVGPLLAAAKVRQVMRAIELARSGDDLVAALKSPEARDVAIDLIAADNHLPRFVASWLYERLVRRLSSGASA
jgi:hypothetical protein